MCGQREKYVLYLVREKWQYHETNTEKKNRQIVFVWTQDNPTISRDDVFAFSEYSTNTFKGKSY